MVCIFILGYGVGKFGIVDIINNIIVSYIELGIIEKIGFVSSLVTLMLFVTYIIGKLFIISQMKITISENVYISCNDEPSDLRVVDEYNLGVNNSEQVYIVSSEAIWWIKIYESVFDEKLNTCIKRNLILEHGLLKNGLAIKLNTFLPCTLPRYIIEYQRFDYIIGELPLSSNGRNGVYEEQLHIKHTFKSMLYYLVK